MKEHASRHGLGYKPTTKDSTKDKETARKKREAAAKRVPYGGPNPPPFSHDMTDYFTKGGVQTDETREGTLMENWAKFQDSLNKCRGTKIDPVRQMFLDSPEIPGATTTIQSEYSLRGMPELVEQFEKTQ